MVHMIEYIKNINANFPEEITQQRPVWWQTTFSKCKTTQKLSRCWRSKQWHFIMLPRNCYSSVRMQGATYSPNHFSHNACEDI